jgi:ATP-dependent Clp protease ATP-binding subunit ClpC
MFERYTEQARRAVFSAHFEAVQQHADKISTAHLLVGLTRDGGSRADAVGSLTENETQLRSQLRIPQSSKTATDPAPKPRLRLDNDSKKVLAYAAEEAKTDDEYWIDTDHLLRGMLRFSNEASSALQSIHLDLIAARAASKRHRVEFPRVTGSYQKLFGSPIRAHRGTIAKLLAFLVVTALGVLLIRLLN